MDGVRARQADCPALTILHTNDFHNKLSEAQANRLRLRHESLGDCGLLLDAGDAVGSGNLTFHLGGEPILERMSAIGYDAMTSGNREFHFSRIGFHAKTSKAVFPVLCANVRPTALNPAPDVLPVQPWIVLERPGWKVVVLGLMVPMITERMWERRASAYVFDDPIATADRLVPELREREAPDLFIALTHIGYKRDLALAEAVPGIDLIIGGHSHTVMQEGERVGHTLIAQTGSHGRHLGRIEAQRSSDDGTLQLCAALETL